MKKLVKVFGLLAVVICMGATLVACGGITGTYKGTYSETAMGVTYSTEMTLQLKSGDKFTMTAKISMGSESSENSVDGTYSVDGEKLTLKVDGNDIEATIKDGVITLDYEGITFELKK